LQLTISNSDDVSLYFVQQKQ